MFAFRAAARAAALAAGPIAAAAYFFHDAESDLVTAADGVLRFTRAAYAGAYIALDYKLSLKNSSELSSEAEKQLKSEIHLRSAQRLLELCRQHKGIFIKGAQYVASLNHVAPPEYTRTLSELQDRVEPERLSDCDRVFREDFQKTLGEVFADFGQDPIASASLAQVHVGRLRDGREVAVKIQYPRLKMQLGADIFTMKTLVTALGWAFPDLQLAWTVPEFRASLERELDFELEGRTAERVAARYADMPNLKVPDIVWPLTSHRVLTMEYCPGTKVTDAPALRAAGIAPKAVARTLLQLFSRMIFVDGFVHCDPHPGNLLVRAWAGAPGGFQLVLLDHGLYRELDDAFRRDYCALWHALIRRDAAVLQAAARRLGAERYAALLPLFLIQRPWSGLRPGLDTSAKMSHEELRQLRAELRERGLGHGDFVNVMQDLPRDMLLVLRTNNFLRSINKELGAPVSRLNIMGQYALLGLYSPWPPRAPGCPVSAARAAVKTVRFAWDMGKLRLNIALLELLVTAMRWYLVLYWHARSRLLPALRLARPPSGPGPALLFREKLG